MPYTNQIFWDITRASGFATLALLLLAFCLGMAIRRGWWDGDLNRREVSEVHRFVSIATVVALGVHIASLLPDEFVRFNLVQALIPFVTGYRTLGVAAGILAMYGIVTVFVSGYHVAALGHPTWFRLHRLSYGALALAVAHVLATGTDRFAWWSLMLCGAALALVIASRFSPKTGRPGERLDGKSGQLQ